MEEYYIMLRVFIMYYMHNMMYDELELPNIFFIFKEPAAKKEILEMIEKEIKLNYLDTETVKRLNEIVEGINNPNYEKQIVEVSDYKAFFTNIEKFLSFEHDPVTKQTMLKFIWLRMTPDDFKNPEAFFEKNIKMLKDKTFEDYKYEVSLPESAFFEGYDITAKSVKSKFYNESVKEMIFTIYDGQEYVTLPVVRYGIYEKDGELICEIGSIQSIEDYYADASLDKKINRLKYKLNKEVDNDLLDGVEPKNLISLLLFINMLREKGITKISVPGLYPLDYEYHIKRKDLYKIFMDGRWYSSEKIEENKAQYDLEMHAYNRVIRVNNICKNKSTNFIKLFERLSYHLEDIRIINYPLEVSSYLELEIPELSNIKGEYVKKIINRS